jgi:hypothetical protein
MKNVLKKLLILSCFASLAHCQMGYAGYFGSWGSYLANSSIVKTATDVSASLFDMVREHPYATAAIGVSAAFGSLSAYTFINSRKVKREQAERIRNLPCRYEDLPEQINGPEPEVIDNKINDVNDLFVIRNKMFELGLLSVEEVMLLHKSEKRIKASRVSNIEAIRDVVETSDASEDKKREFYTWLDERLRNNKPPIKDS